MNVIIVDDEPKIRRGLKLLIDWEQEGFHVVALCANAQEALNAIETKEVDIVLTDICMPDMDGLSLCDHLQKQEPGISTLILSGHHEFEYARKAMRSKVRDYLLKPVDEDVLLQALHKIREERLSRKFVYPQNYEAPLIKAVQHCELDELQAEIKELFLEFDHNRIPIQAIKKNMSLLFLKIEETVLPHGIRFDELFGEEPMEQTLQKNHDAISIKDELVRRLSMIINRSRQGQNATLMNQIKDHIRNNIKSPINLNTVAAQFLLNPSYLSQLFQKHHEGGFSAFVSSVRLQRAKKLLEQEGLRITEIAEDVGYADAKYFSRLFKREFGMLPSEYRASQHRSIPSD
ncbi:MAG: response regulator [Spirochaetales bacterium]|nr:response regulator [Spirochaetales bacterium]